MRRLKTYDCIIVGAGILGLATAYHIKMKAPNDTILIVDKFEGPGFGDTSKSAAAFREFFYSRANILLARSTIDFYWDLQKNQGIDLGIKWIGYLFLMSHSEFESLVPILKKMSREGIEYKTYLPEDLEDVGFRTHVLKDEEARLMNLKNIDVGLFIPRAGILKIENIVKFYETELKQLDVDIMYRTEVKGFILEPTKPIGIPEEPFPWQEIKVSGIRTNRGTFRAKRKIVVAVGAWCESLLNPIGIGVPIRPKKRQIFVLRAENKSLLKLLRSPKFNKEEILPVTILPRGIYIRPEPSENAFWVGYADKLGRAYTLEEDPQPEEEFYIYGIYPVLTKYIPQFIDIRPINAWAGHYDINVVDGVPIVHEEANLIVVGGTSGSGIMKADALGRIVAATYIGEEYAELYGGIKIRAKDLSLSERRIEPEKLVI